MKSLTFLCSMFCSICSFAQTPGDLLIYYGFPSAINGAPTVDDAAQDFGQYDIVVIGDCIQEDGSSANPLCPTPHPDNMNVSNIIQNPVTQNTRFFGYIPIGVTNGGPDLDIPEIARRAGLWEQLGVDGVLLDQYGSEFGVTRQRQNEAVTAVHNAGLAVIANAFFVDDAFSTIGVDPVNGQPRDETELTSDDFYLFESHQIRLGDFVSESTWQDKSNQLETFRNQIGFQILSITTNNMPNSYSEGQFFYSWSSAAMYEHTATGWGEFNFSAGMPGQPHADFAPFRERPSVAIDILLTPLPPPSQGSLYERTACNGVLSVNAAAGMESSSFTPGGFCQPVNAPDELLIYYAFPSLINGASSNSQAALEYSQYDFVVIGDCIQEDGTTTDTICPSPHPDNANVMDIIQNPIAQNTSFFGYIGIGVSGPFAQNLDIIEIQRRASLWQQLGVTGILFDQFGYDFGVTRQRQNAVISIAHSLGLDVIANGFVVDDVFSPEVDPVNNPSGDPTMLSGDDYYLFESHQISIGNFVPESAWQAKANRLEFFRDQIGFQILSITTNSDTTNYSEDQFFYSWHSAAMYEHTATGWGEFGFSSFGSNADMAPFRARPAVVIDTFVTPLPPDNQGSLYQRSACNGTLFINATAGMEDFGFDLDEFCLLFLNSFESPL